MNMHFKMRVATLAVSVVLLGGTALVASGQTGAYFSDTHAGAITGSIGSIAITPDSPTSIAFQNLLPGVAQTVQVNYHNSGSSPEDIYLVFNNLTALSALNNLGRYGSVIITSSGTGALGTDFTSYNLDDNSTRCGPFSNAIPSGPTSGCWPLTSQIEIATNVAPGVSGNFDFAFEYASALTTPSTNQWNPYPLPNSPYVCVAGPVTPTNCNTNAQFTVNEPADGTGAGLPYQLVATQVGITPNAPGSKF
jgi:hypothetical protein